MSINSKEHQFLNVLNWFGFKQHSFSKCNNIYTHFLAKKIVRMF